MNGSINSAIAFFAMNDKRIPGNEAISEETVIKTAGHFYEEMVKKASEKKEESKDVSN